jgi:hypothetical protein
MKHRGLVVFLDALGTSGLPAGTDWDEVLARRKRILARAQAIDLGKRGAFRATHPETGEGPLIMEETHMTPSVIAFSDTLAFTVSSEDHPFDAVMLTIQDLARLFVAAVKEGELLRGVVVSTEFYMDGSLIVGPWVRDVKRLHDSMNWAGVVLAPETAKLLHPNHDSSAGYTRWLVPTKQGTMELWALCWPSFWKVEGLTAEGLRAQVNLVFDRGKGRTDVEEKRAATLEFVDAIQPWSAEVSRRRSEERKVVDELNARMPPFKSVDDPEAIRWQTEFHETLRTEGLKRGFYPTDIPRSAMPVSAEKV